MSDLTVGAIASMADQFRCLRIIRLSECEPAAAPPKKIPMACKAAARMRAPHKPQRNLPTARV